MLSDLSLDYFKILRNHFFDEKFSSVPFYLKLKKNTQDDPFDTYLSESQFNIPNACRARAPGPLITPDFVFYRNPLPNSFSCLDTTQIIGVENKRIELRPSEIPRLSSIDFNSTPPCGKIRIFKNDNPFDIRGFYLVSIIDSDKSNAYQKIMKAFCLVDGDFFNNDFNFYLESVGPREKKIEIGSYKDGIDRVRPMFVFPNPICLDDLSSCASLIHEAADLDKLDSSIVKTHKIIRSSNNNKNTFYVYRSKIDCDNLNSIKIIENPFLDKKLKKETSQRGKFKL